MNEGCFFQSSSNNILNCLFDAQSMLTCEYMDSRKLISGWNFFMWRVTEMSFHGCLENVEGNSRHFFDRNVFILSCLSSKLKKGKREVGTW